MPVDCNSRLKSEKLTLIHYFPKFLSATAADPSTMSIFCRIDDKHVPIYRVLWVSATPHFCGEAECQCEGRHEVALEGGESVWADFDEKERLIQMIDEWQQN